MKNYFIISFIFILGCQDNTNNKSSYQNQLIKRNKIENAHTYDIDLDSSIVNWIGKKVYKNHYGTLNFSSGNVQIKDGNVVGGQFQIDMHSMICTDIKKQGPNQGLINHLKSEDFFDVKNHPFSNLKIINSEKKSTTEYLFLAELTIKNIVHPITFNGYINKKLNIYYSKINLSFDRTLWNIKYGSGKFFEELGDKTILDDIELEIKLLTKSN